MRFPHSPPIDEVRARHGVLAQLVRVEEHRRLAAQAPPAAGTRPRGEEMGSIWMRLGTYLTFSFNIELCTARYVICIHDYQQKKTLSVRKLARKLYLPYLKWKYSKFA